MTSPTVNDLAMPESATASAIGSRQEEIAVSTVRQGMTAEDRAEALVRANALVSYFDAEQHLFWALWCRDGDFASKAAYDLAWSNYARATQIRDSLMRQG